MRRCEIVYLKDPNGVLAARASVYVPEIQCR